MSISMPQNDTPAAPKRRFVMTEKRLAANRRNARKSTGPRTPAGKQKASQNGKPHPICSTDAFDRLEGTDVYGLHLAEMTKAFDPRNLMQAQLFPQLVALSWELTRMHEAEVKLIERLREHDDELPCEVIARVFASGEKNNPLVAHERYWRAKQNHYWRMVKQFEVLARWERSPEPNFQENWDAMLKREADARAAAVRQASRNRAEHVRRDEQRIQREAEARAQREMERGEPIAPPENRDSGPEMAVCATVAENTNPLTEDRPSAERPKPTPLPDPPPAYQGREEEASGAFGGREKEASDAYQGREHEASEVKGGAGVSPAILSSKRGRDARATKT